MAVQRFLYKVLSFMVDSDKNAHESKNVNRISGPI